MAKLTEIECIGETYAEKLASAGIKTTDELLANGAAPKNRADLAAAADISGKLILRWVNLADLFRIKGVAEQYADLLEAAGVDTVVELAQRNAANLHEKLLSVNEEMKFVRRPPSASEVSAWVEQAKELPRAVTY